jgi:hypothetical protein
MTEKPSKSRFPRLLRLPSFGIALGASVAALLAFAVWAFVDASFPVTLEIVRIDLRLQEHPGLDMTETHGWDELGPRLLLFATLAAVGALATLLVFYRILFGSRQGRSLRSLFLAVALVGLWLTLSLSREKLESAGFQWRLHRAAKGLKQDAAILLAEWPMRDGVLPYSGPYTAEGRKLVVPWSPSKYPMNLKVGPFIGQRGDNQLIFFLFPDRIEYYPEGRQPGPATGPKLLFETYIEIEPNWYFVTFSQPEPISEAGGWGRRQIGD